MVPLWTLSRSSRSSRHLLVASTIAVTLVTCAYPAHRLALAGAAGLGHRIMDFPDAPETENRCLSHLLSTGSYTSLSLVCQFC